jgi:hypothetical protein
MTNFFTTNVLLWVVCPASSGLNTIILYIISYTTYLILYWNTGISAEMD